MPVSVQALLALSFPAPPSGQINVPYSDTLTASGGSTPDVWSLSAGSLPAGLTLGASSGVLAHADGGGDALVRGSGNRRPRRVRDRAGPGRRRRPVRRVVQRRAGGVAGRVHPGRQLRRLGHRPGHRPGAGLRPSYLIAGGGYSLSAAASADLSTASLGTSGLKLTAPDGPGTATDAIGFAAANPGYYSGSRCQR